MPSLDPRDHRVRDTVRHGDLALGRALGELATDLANLPFGQFLRNASRTRLSLASVFSGFRLVALMTEHLTLPQLGHHPIVRPAPNAVLNLVTRVDVINLETFQGPALAAGSVYL